MSVADRSSPADLARLVDLQLPDDPTCPHHDPTLFEVRASADLGSVRLVEIASGDDPYQMLWVALASVVERPREIPAIALVTTGVMSRIDGGLDDDELERRRVRVVTVVNEFGTAVTARCDDGEVLHFDDGGDGALPVAMRAWWRAARNGHPTRGVPRQ